jgi:hypothetical protein
VEPGSSSGSIHLHATQTNRTTPGQEPARPPQATLRITISTKNDLLQLRNTQLRTPTLHTETNHDIKELLDAPEARMVWEIGEEAWENKLAALRSCRRATGHLAPRQDALWGEGEAMVPVGQHMANLRWKGGLGKDAERAAERATQLAAIDPDWNCPWPLNWQRHYRVLADLVDADGHLPYIAPGVTFEGDDIGTWRWRQQEPGTWTRLLPEQRERLTALGIEPTEAPSPTPAATRAKKRPEQGTVSVSAGTGSPHAVGRTGRNWMCGYRTPNPGGTGLRRSSWTRCGSWAWSGREAATARPLSRTARGPGTRSRGLAFSLFLFRRARRLSFTLPLRLCQGVGDEV